MKEFFDTSVLVAVFWGEHIHHTASLNRFARATRNTSCCAAHSLAEVFSVLTRLPVRPAITPQQALLFLEQISQRLIIVDLRGAEYLDTILEAAKDGVSGGRIYDALLLACARKAKADKIYTWNLDDFERIDPDLRARIRNP